MAKYTVNMADQLLKVREKVQEKLKKEAEVVVEIEQPSALQSATADYLSRKEEPHPLGSPKNLNEMKKVEIKLNRGNVDKDIQKIVKHIGLVNKKRRANQQIKITQNMSDDSVTLDGGKNVDIDREVADIRNFIGYKSAKVVESVEEETLDEAMDKKTAIAILKMKKKEDFYGREGAMIYMSPDERDALKKKVGRLGRDVPGPSKGVSTMIIINTALGKDGTDGNRGDYDTEGKKMINMRKGGKSIGTPRTIGDAMKLAGIREETLDEGRMKELAMKIAQVYSNMKKDKNMRSFADKFRKDVAKSLDIRKSLEKVLPDYVAGKDITNIMSKHVPGHKEENKVEEAKLIDKPTGEVLKTGSKEDMETERKRNRDELQVQEWFKSKNIDVKVRQLEESTQVYVPLGRRIPNEIREELITTQYGKMPEDVKNVKDINYGNFMENSITMNNDFWTKVLHGTKGE